MRKMMIGLAALFAASSANAAVLVAYTGGPSANPLGFTMVQDFESFAVGASLGPNAKVYNSDVPNDAAIPGFNSTGKYGAVLGLPTAGSYSLSFTGAKIFSFVIGSLDSYNRLTLSLSDGSTVILNGAQIALGATANGDQDLPSSNGRVFYYSDGPLINGATFSSTNNSFEFDNLMTGNVPEPSTWAMMVLGFGIVGRALRRRRKMAIASFA